MYIYTCIYGLFVIVYDPCMIICGPQKITYEPYTIVYGPCMITYVPCTMTYGVLWDEMKGGSSRCEDPQGSREVWGAPKAPNDLGMMEGRTVDGFGGMISSAVMSTAGLMTFACCRNREMISVLASLSISLAVSPNLSPMIKMQIALIHGLV